MDGLQQDQETKRLIVLIDNMLASNHELAHRLYWMAERDHLAILYMVLVDDQKNMIETSRNMATMKAVTSANSLMVESVLTNTGEWFETLSNIARPGDIVVCQKGQTIIDSAFKAVPICEYLPTCLNFPVIAISGYYQPAINMAAKRMHEAFALAGFLIILALFTFLQIKLEEVLVAPQANVFMIGSVCVELGVIWGWYQFAYS